MNAPVTLPGVAADEAGSLPPAEHALEADLARLFRNVRDQALMCELERALLDYRRSRLP